MEASEFFETAYNGTKQFTQHDVQTANATGFGAAADDYAERGIDLNEQLIMNKPATFFMRMNGDAMSRAGIEQGDILVVDRSLKPANGKIVVSVVDGELLVRRYQQTFNKLFLKAEGPGYTDTELGEFSNYMAWGVVTCVIHMLEKSLLTYNRPNAVKKGKH